MTKNFVRVIAVVVLAVATQQSLACRCLKPASTADAYGSATVVVRAKVLSVEGVGDSPGGWRACTVTRWRSVEVRGPGRGRCEHVHNLRL